VDDTYRYLLCFSLFFTPPSSTDIYTLSLHDALPICCGRGGGPDRTLWLRKVHPLPLHQPPRDHRRRHDPDRRHAAATGGQGPRRSEEHTSELQSPYDLVCRLLLEKKKQKHYVTARTL